MGVVGALGHWATQSKPEFVNRSLGWDWAQLPRGEAWTGHGLLMALVKLGLGLGKPLPSSTQLAQVVALPKIGCIGLLFKILLDAKNHTIVHTNQEDSRTEVTKINITKAPHQPKMKGSP